VISAGNKSKPQRTLIGVVECPHCWHRSPITDLVWISEHSDLRGDPIAGASAALRFRPSRFTPGGAAIDLKGEPCQRVACPRCHLPLPPQLLECRPMIFSMIGVPSSGKSYFLAAMAWELRHRLAELFKVSVTDADPESNLLVNDYERTLFLHGDAQDWVYLDKTQTDGDLYDRVRLSDQNVSLPHPFLFTLRPLEGHPRFSKVKEFTRLLCFYDNAGEHFQPGTDKATSPATQHVARARVLFFLVGPSQDPRFRQRCKSISQDPQLNVSDGVERQETILTEALLRVRHHANLDPHQRIETPLILLVAKSDMWDGLIDEDIASDPYLPGSDGHPHLVDFERIARVSAQVRGLLREVMPELVAAAEDACAHVEYLPISALGGPPSARPIEGAREMLMVQPQAVHPRWVTVPLVYAFAKWSHGLFDPAQVESE
jgi:hypothetical protein